MSFLNLLLYLFYYVIIGKIKKHISFHALM